MAPDVSIVVVNFRSAGLTLRALADAERAAGPLAVEQIVVDNGSGAEEVERLKAELASATLVALPDNAGFAAGNNVGIARATGRHLLLLNPDSFCHDDAVQRLVAHLDAHPDVGVVAPRLLFADGARQDNAYRRFPNHWTLLADYCAPLGHLLVRTPWDPYRVPHRRYGPGRPPLRVAHVSGAAFMVRREAARDAGPLDEGYFLYYEETEWQRRIAAAGWAVEVLPDAVVTHLGGASSDSFPLASPHYLASVDRWFGASRRSRAIVVAGALVSWLTLSPAARAGARPEVLSRQARGYREVLRAAPMLAGVPSPHVILQSALSRMPQPLSERAGALLHRSPRLRSAVHATLLRRMQSGDVEIFDGPAKGLRFNASGGPTQYVLGQVEPDVQAALKRVLRAGDTFYDVGASIGFFTVLGARLVGPQGRVVAVEPFPTTVGRLRHNVELNGFANVTVEEAAAADRPGQGTFRAGDRLVWGTLVDGEDSGDGITVRLLTIDALAAQGPAPSAIKLDIEGAEVSALQGAQDTLARVRPIVVCETHGTRDEVVALLERHDYAVTALDGTPLKPKGPEAAEPLNPAWFDHILARPRERGGAGAGH